MPTWTWRSPARPTASSSTRASAATPARACTSSATSTTRWSQGISDEARKIKVGPGLDPDTQMGPLTSAEQRDKVLGYMSSGLDAGARAPAGGGRVGDRGYFVEPTVLTDTTPDMKVVREEIFGPVVCAIPFDSEDDDVIQQRQRHELRPRVGDLDARHQQGAPDRPPPARRHGVDQLLQRVRRRDAVRRLQGVGLGPGDGPQRARELPRDQVRGHPARIARRRPCNGRGGAPRAPPPPIGEKAP